MASTASALHEPPAFDVTHLRRVLGSFATGVTVITTRDEAGRRHGLTVNSFASVSLDPPLVLWSQSVDAPSHPVFRACARFAVNILAAGQVALSQRFASRLPDKFEGVATREGSEGAPLLEGCAAWLECELENCFPGGDHRIFIGRVRRIETAERPPLVFAGGRYHGVHPL